MAPLLGSAEDQEDSSVEGFEASDDADEYTRGAPQLPWGIEKQVLREAAVEVWPEGRPTSGDRVSLQYTARLQDGTQIGTSRGEKPFCFTIDEQPREVVVGMDLAVLTMRRTELAEFKIAPRFAYDDLGSPPLVPPGATLLFEIELLGWERQEDLFGDGEAIKTVVRAGDGATVPVRGQRVLIDMNCVDRKGKPLQEQTGLEFSAGDPLFGPLSRAVSSCLLSMSEGEEARVVFGRYFAPCSTDRRFALAVLTITLRKVVDTSDISLFADGSLLKTVVVKGKGEPQARDGAMVELHVESATDVDSAEIYGFTGSRTLQFAAGNGDVCDALEFAAAAMRVGERAVVTCNAPSQQCLELDLGLVRFECPEVLLTVELRAVAPLPEGAASPRGLLGRLQARKDVAADLYGRGRHVLAIVAYRGIAGQLGDADAPDVAQTDDGRVLRRACELNWAACALKSNDFLSARDLCSKVLAEDPGNVKALFRRASSNHGLSEYELAQADLAEALRLDPSNAEAMRLTRQVREAQKRYARDAREAASRMITGRPTEAAEQEAGGGDAWADAPEAGSVPAAVPEDPAPLWVRLLGLSACLPGEQCLQLWAMVRGRHS